MTGGLKSQSDPVHISLQTHPQIRHVALRWPLHDVLKDASRKVRVNLKHYTRPSVIPHAKHHWHLRRGIVWSVCNFNFGSGWALGFGLWQSFFLLTADHNIYILWAPSFCGKYRFRVTKKAIHKYDKREPQKPWVALVIRGDKSTT